MGEGGWGVDEPRGWRQLDYIAENVHRSNRGTPVVSLRDHTVVIYYVADHARFDKDG